MILLTLVATALAYIPAKHNFCFAPASELFGPPHPAPADVRTRPHVTPFYFLGA